MTKKDKREIDKHVKYAYQFNDWEYIKYLSEYSWTDEEVEYYISKKYPIDKLLFYYV